MFDLVVQGCSIVDGTGAPARPGDVAIAGGRIVRIGPPGSITEPATRVIDATGLVLAAHFWRTSAGTAILLSACAAFVAYAGSRRAFDAAVLALPPLAGWWVDADVGPPAFLAACLVPWLLTRRALFAAVIDDGDMFGSAITASDSRELLG